MQQKRAIAPVWKWAIAAALVAAAGLSVYIGADRFFVPSGAGATVASLDGTLYRVAAGRNTPLARGAAIADLENVRTARGSAAVVRLRDGSLIEMRERTEVALSERRAGVTIRLAAGDIIVQAAKQRPRHLYVDTTDCLVSVTGTVFAVDRGVKGSRVSVVEGEVHVTQGQDTQVLHPGDQVSTSASLTAVPVEQDIAWSRNAGQYVALLAEFGKLRQKLEALPGPGLRYSTKLLDLAPAGTVFYAAVPNLGPALNDANRILHEELAQSAPLRQWWAHKMSAPGSEAKLNDALARVQAFSAYLGPEIAVAMNGHDPLIVAEVVRPGFRDFLAQQVGGQPEIRIVDDPLHAAPVAKALYIYTGLGLVAVSPDLAQLQKLVQPGQNAFDTSAFHDRIAQTYRTGVAWLIAADVHSALAHTAQNKNLEGTGFSDAQYLIVERKDVSGQTENRAQVTFTQARRGVASWLAAPAPIRALDFVSADAAVAGAAVVKDPAALLDDAFAMASASNSSFLSQLAAFETASGVSLREDLARPLGGEFAFAIDGPLLPMPSWKLVLEVYDPPHFQQALEKLLARAQARIETEQAGGRTYYMLHVPKLPFAPQYTYEGGFLIAAPSRELILRALEYRTTGYSLVRSQKFTALLPHDGQVGFSAMFYQTLGTALGPLANSGVLTPQQRKMLTAAAGAAGPSLVLAYGQPDRIELASAGAFFGLHLEHFLGLAGKH
jgi:hypothetical protein